MAHSPIEHQRRFDCQVRWPTVGGNASIPPEINEFERLPGLVRLEWRINGIGSQ
jgi:hypothetical protein